MEINQNQPKSIKPSSSLLRFIHIIDIIDRYHRSIFRRVSNARADPTVHEPTSRVTAIPRVGATRRDASSLYAFQSFIFARKTTER